MDPVTAHGAAAAAAQLAQMALQPLFVYYKSAAGARRDMYALQVSLTALKSSLDCLVQLGDDANTEVLRAIVFHPLDAASGHTLVDAMRDNLSKLERKLHGAAVLRTRLVWPLRAAEVAEIVKQIDRYVHVLSLSLDLENM
jgi:hypothetical protein